MELLLSHEIDKISSFDIFCGLSRTIVERAVFGALVKQAKHREYIFRAGDDAQRFYIIVEGAIKLIRHSPRGEDIIVHFAVQGDVVGALVINENAVYPISAKSMGPSRIICIPKSTFKQYWQPDVDIQGRLNALLYRRMNNIQEDKIMSTSPLRVRIANLLLRHLDQDSGTTSQSPSLSLTRQEIADALGVAVESVIRAMRDWLDDGTISRHRGSKNTEIINVEKLLKNFEF